MKLNQLKAFQEIMLTGSVSEAARKLHRTQPSISAAIASLEEDLEMQLFERRNGRLHPVPEAQYLLNESAQLLDRLETLKRNMRGLKSLTTGHLEVVTMPGAAVFWLPNLISNFSAEKPNISSEVISRSSDRVYQQITAQQFDIGIADYHEPQITENSLLKASIFSFKCLCAINIDDPLAQKEAITPQDLRNRKLATLFPEHEISRNIEHSFSQVDIVPQVRFRAQYFLPLLTFVERGQALGIVDPIAAASYKLYRNTNRRVTFRPFRPVINYRISLIRPVHKTSSRISDAFAAELEEQFMAIGATKISER
ncbi:MAG: LysR family transcriptional regulator [Rhodobacteraceae bacterium]|nr:LysR family transcriptional regulator [Paracoccaceae bacterium]